MSYNGIGLKSARGSGTSGHVTKNLASLGDKLAYEQSRVKRKEARGQKSKISDEQKQKIKEELQADLLSHEELRHIENRCISFQDDLEDLEVDPELVKKQVSEFREKLVSELKEAKSGKKKTVVSDSTATPNLIQKSQIDDESPTKSLDKKSSSSQVYQYRPLYKDDKTEKRSNRQTRS